MQKLALLLSIMILAAGISLAQTSAFNYQGKLASSGVPANGDYQFQFKLFGGAAAVDQFGPTQTVVATVQNRIFTTRLDFGAAAFPPHTDLWFANGNFTRSSLLDAKSPGAVIKSFYYWYINAIAAGTDPFKEGRATLQKYVTLRLIKQIERSKTDADAFMQSQEWDKAWAEAATFSNLRINGTTATAIVTFDATTNYPRVSLTLVKEAGLWKIDQVRNAAQ
jgi:hypothetical protein